jgi:hypothetical protein
MEPLSYSDSIMIDAAPETVYDLVSDVTRTGEWSPVCRACWWHDDAGPHEGAWFSGRNEADGKVWETQSQVAVAQRGREFAWLVGGRFVRWSFTFTPVAGQTRVTESWEFLPEGRAMFQKKYGSEAEQLTQLRVEQAHTGIPRSLAAIKRIVESN